MQARHWRGVAALAAVTALLAAFAGGAQARTDGGSGATAAASYKVGIVYSRTGPAGRLRRRVHPGPALRARVRDEGHDEGQRSPDRADDRRRRHAIRRRPSPPVEGPDRPGLQDPRRQRPPPASPCRWRRSPRRTRSCSSPAPPRRTPSPGINKYTFRSGRQTYQDVKTAATFLEGRRQEGRPSSRRTPPSASATTRPSTSIVGSQGHNVSRDARAALGAGLHAVRAAGEAGEPGPALRRLGRHDRARDVARARAAGRLRRLEQDHDRASPSGRPGRPSVTSAAKIDFLSHYVYTRAEEQGQRLPRHLDAEARPGARPVHARTASSPAR